MERHAAVPEWEGGRATSDRRRACPGVLTRDNASPVLPARPTVQRRRVGPREWWSRGRRGNGCTWVADGLVRSPARKDPPASSPSNAGASPVSLRRTLVACPVGTQTWTAPFRLIRSQSGETGFSMSWRGDVKPAPFRFEMLENFLKTSRAARNFWTGLLLGVFGASSGQFCR